MPIRPENRGRYPATIALRRMDAAGAEFVAAWRAAGDDPDHMAAANDAYAAALDVIGADIDIGGTT